jgi:SNF2 family DNA or RNA helicase
LGYQKGDAVSNYVTKFNEPNKTEIFINLFDEIWKDEEKIEDVTTRLSDHIATIYKENSPEKIYFIMLYNIFNEFLEDLNEDVLPNDLTGYQDSGYFVGDLLDYLDSLGHGYLIKVKLKNLVPLLSSQQWEAIKGKPGWEQCQFWYKAGS